MGENGYCGGAQIVADNTSGLYRFYGRRRGRKLRAGRQKLLDESLCEVEIDLGRMAAPARLFDFAPREIWLEIGFGGGEHLAWQACEHPDIAMIGAEPFVNGIASLLSHIKQDELSNIRIWPDDVRPLLDALPDDCLARVFILHPDPWPKSRHAARRIVGGSTLDRLAALMKEGAELRIATDDRHMIEWVLRQAGNHPDFDWTARVAGDWRMPPTDWPATRYEKKSKREGRRPTYLKYVRVQRD